MTSAGKVADIFSAAGEAFTRLGTLTMQLQPLSSEKGATSQAGKWGEEEINLLKEAVTRFGEDLASISEKVKKKSVAQTKATLRDKVTQPMGSASTSGHIVRNPDGSMPALVPIGAGKQEGQKASKTKTTDMKYLQSPPTKKARMDSQSRFSSRGGFDEVKTDNDLTIDVEG